MSFIMDIAWCLSAIGDIVWYHVVMSATGDMVWYLNVIKDIVWMLSFWTFGRL